MLLFQKEVKFEEFFGGVLSFLFQKSLPPGWVEKVQNIGCICFQEGKKGEVQSNSLGQGGREPR
jgi:hypothetical protein